MSELNSRELKLISMFIDEDDYLPVHTIAEKLNISTKTVYRDIDKISLKKHDLIFEKKQGKGIKLINRDFAFNILNSKQISRYSLKERRIKILFHLLKNTKEYVTIENLSYKYYVSKSSIVNDLVYIEKNFLGENLNITKTRQGTRIEGEEKYIRNKIVELINKYSFINGEEYEFSYSSERINKETINELKMKFDLKKLTFIENIVNKYEDRLPYTIGDLYYTNLVVHILIAIERISSGNYIDNIQSKIGEDKDYYREAKNIARELEKIFDIVFPNSEIYYIYQYLVSTGVGNVREEISVVVDKSIEDISENFLSKIGATNLFDIDSSKNIYYVFKLHIRALIKRLKYNISIRNPLTNKIKRDYKDVFLSVKNIANETISDRISDDEIAYLTMYVQSILEDNINHKNVVLVCHSGFGTSQFLKKRIETIFKKINIVDVLSSRELETYDFSSIDYIISTVKIDIDFPNVINVNVLLLDQDIELINRRVFG